MTVANPSRARSTLANPSRARSTSAEMSEKKRLANELHAPARRNFPRRRVLALGYDDLWQADIAEMQPYAKANRGYRYVLTVIDVLSKYAWALPLKSKSGSDVAKAFSAILSERCPKNLQTDQGKEFYNTAFQSLMKKHGINHYSTYSVMKASVVERFNRTLKNAMWKMFTLNGSYRWLEALPRLVREYNGRVHRTIGMRPKDVDEKDARRLLSIVYPPTSARRTTAAKFKVGDKVRVSKFKTTFAKGYTPNWTTEVFEIAKAQRTNPRTYLLKDYRGDPIAGRFYEHELLAAKNPNTYLVEKVLRTKGNKAYVKWLGFDSTHNSWIDKKNILRTT